MNVDVNAIDRARDEEGPVLVEDDHLRLGLRQRRRARNNDNSHSGRGPGNPFLMRNREDRLLLDVRASTARTAARKSPQCYYLTISIVMALLAIIIAEQPFGPASSASSGGFSPQQAPMSPPLHDWMRFFRRIPNLSRANEPAPLTKTKVTDPDKLATSEGTVFFYKRATILIQSHVLPLVEYLGRWIDPILLGEIPESTTMIPTQDNEGEQQQQEMNDNVATVATKLMDKVFTSTPRLMIFVNLILSITFVTHASIANYYLGRAATPSGGTADRIPQTNFFANNAFDAQAHFGGGPGGRRRRRPLASRPLDPYTSPTYALRFVGGYILFKLLLISSVLSPLHTLDVLILLAWYTVLCFQRSLAHMAQMNLNRSMQQMVLVTQQSDQPQSGRDGASAAATTSGVLHLLLVVLVLTICSGCGCVMFFYKAGMPMVLLLLMDSVILILDVVRYIVSYVQGIVLEGSYHARMNELEEIQLQHSWESMGGEERRGLEDSHGLLQEHETITERHHPAVSVEGEIGQLELRHSMYTSILQTSIFMLELMSSLVTAFHFLHIWYLHGLSFGLVDAVLLLHLHSAVSTISRKVAERHQMFRLSRSLNSIFEDATAGELRKAHACGDLCCICLGSMLGANVKKLKCGHLYHSHCLRKVVERARSMSAARCPLCRSSIVGQREGRTHARETGRSGRGGTSTVDEAAFAIPHRDRNNADSFAFVDNVDRLVNEADLRQVVAAADVRPHQIANENALFRFSTEGILPAWLPLPSISFEIVRRQPAVNMSPGLRNAHGAAADDRNGADGARETDPLAAEVVEPLRGDHGSTSFLRRLLGIAFAPPMTPEEEETALAQLVEMFPQYERDDLRRELQSRGSIENVAESILLGAFSGLQRTED